MLVVTAVIAERGYEFLPGRDTRAALEAAGSLSDWDAFSASWQQLPVDPYLDESHRFRRRRFAVYAADAAGAIARQPHQPHLQTRQYNRLFGDIERWFEPIAPEIGAGPTMHAVLRFCLRTFGALVPSGDWRIEVHQFRIEARAGLAGEPTPEGVHRDGVDFVLVLLVNRENIASGTTTVYDLEGRPLGSFTLATPLDAALVDDRRVAHGVTPVAPIDPARPANRDVLVVTFRRQAE